MIARMADDLDNWMPEWLQGLYDEIASYLEKWARFEELYPRYM